MKWLFTEEGKPVSEKDHKVSRRQFLNYSLMGVGGFMAAAMVSPMIRSALDPALASSEESEFISVVPVDEITNEPQRYTFKKIVEDAWYTSEQTQTAWIYKDGKDIVALSPRCTHLGCTVDWNSNTEYPNQFFCPCHHGRFEKDGKNIANTPPTRPLDVYELSIKDGIILLGKTIERK